jgi:hypothetical protein
VDFLQHVVGQIQAVDAPAALFGKLVDTIGKVLVVSFEKAIEDTITRYVKEATGSSTLTSTPC